MSGSSFLDRLQSGRMMTREEMGFPCFPVREIGERIEKADQERVLKPTFSYDLAELDAARPEALRRLDELSRERLRQLTDQLIPGVIYEHGMTSEKGSTFIWARPVSVDPAWSPHVAAWGLFLTGIVNQP